MSETVGIEISEKSRLVTSLLAFLIGEFGAHRFYLKKFKTAIPMAILGSVGSVTAIVGVG